MIGDSAGFSNTVFGNVFIGSKSGYSNSSGTDNAFVGYQAGYSNTTGKWNSFFGNEAGVYNTTGYSNAFVGYQAGNHNTTGANNAFMGAMAGFTTTTGSFNTFTGYVAGTSNTTGSANAFFGGSAGSSNTTGQQNTFVGTSSGINSTTASANTFIGYQAGYNSTGASNTFLGYRTGYNITTGSNNIIIGPNSGTAITDGNDNVLMGYNSQADDGLQNAIAIGANSRVAASNALILGNQVNVGIGTSAPVNRLEVVSQSPNTSGLTLTNLTASSPTTRTTDQFLTVSETGEVIKARYQLRINNPSEWSDNVFSPSYQLRSLSSVAAYIDQYKHLPGIPSAEQIAKEGIDLVKMNATLLEKVEELTLYSIQQDKTIQAQQQELQIVKQEQAELKRLLNQLLKQK
ncbi:hypothetical protein [Spirosoma sp.]|uniref:hypothetical protein n=1 Tax=unclassified Spirosoma TaxID=2621999 RepID=UPI00341B0692